MIIQEEKLIISEGSLLVILFEMLRIPRKSDRDPDEVRESVGS